MAKKIQIGLLGSTGKMGVAIRQLLKSNSDFNALVEICTKPTGDFDLSFSDLKKVSDKPLNQVDVWIDFPRPEG